MVRQFVIIFIPPFKENMAASAACPSSWARFTSTTTISGGGGIKQSKCLRPGNCIRWGIPHKRRIFASVSSPAPAPAPALRSQQPDGLVASLFSKVMQTDRGVLLTRDEHNKVAEMADELHKFCVDEPVKCPLIFGEWDVVYCSVPTSPGGGYRSALGRLVFSTKEMIQVVEAPDIVQNLVSFSVLGFLDGEVSLKGKLKALDEKWIQVVFEPPELKIGALEFKYGGESEVKLQITYVDEKMRLGKGSRGSLFVFRRREHEG